MKDDDLIFKPKCTNTINSMYCLSLIIIECILFEIILPEEKIVKDVKNMGPMHLI
jgi:hypothetical protein